MDSMVQRLRSRSFSKTEQNEDDKLQGKPKRTESRKDRVQFDDHVKGSSKQANRSGRRPNVAQKRSSWFLRSQGSFSSDDSRSSSSSMSSETEAVVAVAIALAATADSASSSPPGSLRESPQSTPQARSSWSPMPRIGEESTRHAEREDQHPSDSRALVPSTSKLKERHSSLTEADRKDSRALTEADRKDSKLKERHSSLTEADRKDSRALVPGSRTLSDSSAHGKGRELVPTSSNLGADGKHLDRDDSRRDRRSGSGSLGTGRSRKDSFGRLSYEEGKREKRDAKAVAWLEAETTRIDDRYRQDRRAIQEWENEKKQIANMRMREIERRLEEKRMEALKKMQTEIATIQRKADKKKAEAEAIRMAEQTKVTEMARKIQRTGKMPNQCPLLCC